LAWRIPGDLTAVHSRHGVVEDYDLDWLDAKDFQSGRPVQCRQDLVAGPFEQDLAHLKADEFVVDAKHQMRVSFHRVPSTIERSESPLEYTRAPIFTFRFTIHRTFAIFEVGVR
jgi:hypothetical protein